MLIKIITIVNPVVSMGHYKRSIWLKKNLQKRNNIELFSLKKNPLKELKKIYEKVLKRKKFDYLILDVSNKLILNKKFKEFIELLISKFKNKIVITDSLGKDALFPYLKKRQFILHLPYILNKKNLETLKKKFKLNMLGLAYSSFTEKIKKNRKFISQPYILITFGASDKFNKSYEILKSISNFTRSKILFILGPYFKNSNIYKIKKFIKSRKNIKLGKFKKNLSFYFKKSKMIVTNAGLSKYESIATNKPVLVVYENKAMYNLNKDFIKENLSCNFLIKKENIKQVMSSFLSRNFDFKTQLNNRIKLINKKNYFENYLENNL